MTADLAPVAAGPMLFAHGERRIFQKCFSGNGRSNAPRGCGKTSGDTRLRFAGSGSLARADRLLCCVSKLEALCGDDGLTSCKVLRGGAWWRCVTCACMLCDRGVVWLCWLWQIRLCAVLEAPAPARARSRPPRGGCPPMRTYICGGCQRKGGLGGNHRRGAAGGGGRGCICF